MNAPERATALATPALTERVRTFGRYVLERFGERVHKIPLDAGFTCPNRDGSKGIGGCTFCNNASFAPGRETPSVRGQIATARERLLRHTPARRFLAYFQAYTNTYADVETLERLYRQALAEEGIIGLSVGTRPDCAGEAVLDLLARLRDEGHEVWLELGLQSAHDTTLARVNRGHGFAEYRDTARAARARGLPVCTHLILGLPGEDADHCRDTLDVVLAVGTDGLKLHPLHVVRHTLLAAEWRRGEFRPLSREAYIHLACDLIERTPPEVVFHRLTGTAPPGLLLAPGWCADKWPVLNGIARELERRGTRQGAHAPAR